MNHEFRPDSNGDCRMCAAPMDHPVHDVDYSALDSQNDAMREWMRAEQDDYSLMDY